MSEEIVSNGATMISSFWLSKKFRIGWTHDLVRRDGGKYLERWIIWLRWGTLRMHKFWAGDDGGMYDHPFWFLTFPLRAYKESYIEGWNNVGRAGSLASLVGRSCHDDKILAHYLTPTCKYINHPDDLFVPEVKERVVKAFRFHFRPAHFSHIVHEPDKPVVTLVISGSRVQKWGFWVDDNSRWIPYEEYGVEYSNNHPK